MSRLGLFIRTFLYEDEVSRFNLLCRSLVCNAPLDDFSEIRIYVPCSKLEAQLRTGIQEFEGISEKVSFTSDNTIPQGVWLVVTSDVIVVKPCSVQDLLSQDLLTNCSQPKPEKGGDVGLYWNSQRRSLDHLTQVINTPELVFSPLERNAPFLAYPRNTQVCSEIIYDLVKDWIRRPKKKESCDTITYNQESCDQESCSRESCDQESCSRESCDQESCSRESCDQESFDQESCDTITCDQESCNTKTYDRPLISCLMITKDRLNYVKMSTQCFQDQTYPNKELLIISDAHDGVEDYVNKLRDSRIRFIRPPSNCKTLGQLRNFSLDQARGFYVCQWDDDDWYHPSRLSLQYNVLKKKKAKVCLLGQWLLISPLTQQYGVSAFRKEGWEGSMLAQKDILPRYPSIKRGEDKALMSNLRKRTHVEVITQPGYWLLYGYLIHQNNTWTNHHFQRILIERIPLSSVYPSSSSNYLHPLSTYSNSCCTYSENSSCTYSKSLNYESVSRYLAHRHLFEYSGSKEDIIPVVSKFVYQINLLWIMIVLIIALVVVWLNSRCVRTMSWLIIR